MIFQANLQRLLSGNRAVTERIKPVHSVKKLLSSDQNYHSEAAHLF